MLISTLVVDDEKESRGKICRLLQQVPAMELLKECGTGREAMDCIEKLLPDLVFLDVNLKDMNGLEMWEHIPEEKQPILVVVSAHHIYGSKAFDNHALDYLLKPYDAERFLIAANKVLVEHTKRKQRKIEHNLNRATGNINRSNSWLVDNDILPLKTVNGLFFVKRSQILYFISSRQHHVIAHTVEGELKFRSSLSELSTKLKNHGFLRIHRSTIINLAFVKDVINSNYGEIDVRMEDDKLLRISKIHRTEFLIQMGLYK